MSSDLVRPEPHWEHGYRGHGYWLGEARLGYVGLGPRGVWDGVYRWHVSAGPMESMRNAPGVCAEGGEPSLRRAKRQVERVCRERYAALIGREGRR